VISSWKRAPRGCDPWLAPTPDASVGLKWVLQEPDSRLAERRARSETDLLIPDFWLNEACNVLWLQVRRKLFTPNEARAALVLLREQVEPTLTADLGLHDIALEIGLAINHNPHDTLYVAFARAMGTYKVVVANGPFVTAMRAHSDPALANILLPLASWAGRRDA
jgi:predicted nucleic acid-binding protein